MLSEFAIVPALPASDIARARNFYEETLGFEPKEVDDAMGMAMYRSGGVDFFVYQSNSAGSNQATAASWRVADLDAVMADLRSKGVVFEDYDLPGLKTVDGVLEVPGGRAAWFKDPEGNILALDGST